ncbi:MAG: DUF3089 domain-containing protein [Ilumatobacteraceae bacterium]
MRSLMLIAAAGALLLTSCSSGNDSRGAGDDGGLEINGPANVDMTTIANVPIGGATTDTADIVSESSSAAATTPSTDAASTTAESTTTTPAPSTTFAPYDSEIYSDAANWVCRADTTDVCDDAYPVTEVAADLSLTVEPSAPAVDPPLDCFYVYPTVSGDASFNSDLVADAEIPTTELQAARYNQICSLYVPIYRSVTLGGLFGSEQGDFATGWGMAYQDVLDAWRYYLANLNHGRPVVILSHSQGSFHVVRLLREEIDPTPAQRDLIVSAILPGTSFQVAPGKDVGGDTKNMPLCRKDDQFGCVITFQTFRDNVPPTPGALFGAPGANTDSACVNPASLAGGPAPLDAVLPAGDWVFANPAAAVDLTTGRVGVPGLLTGECKTTAEGYKYLAVTVTPDPTDPRADDIPGDGTPNWGLHTFDMNIAQDNLIDTVRSQSAAFIAAH